MAVAGLSDGNRKRKSRSERTDVCVSSDHRQKGLQSDVSPFDDAIWPGIGGGERRKAAAELSAGSCTDRECCVAAVSADDDRLSIWNARTGRIRRLYVGQGHVRDRQKRQTHTDQGVSEAIRSIRVRTRSLTWTVSLYIVASLTVDGENSGNPDEEVQRESNGHREYVVLRTSATKTRRGHD